jgi:hypothetical protein
MRMIPHTDPVASPAECPQENPLANQRAVPFHGETPERSIHMQRLCESTLTGGLKQRLHAAKSLIPWHSPYENVPLATKWRFRISSALESRQSKRPSVRLRRGQWECNRISDRSCPTLQRDH